MSAVSRSSSTIAMTGFGASHEADGRARPMPRAERRGSPTWFPMRLFADFSDHDDG